MNIKVEVDQNKISGNRKQMNIYGNKQILGEYNVQRSVSYRAYL